MAIHVETIDAGTGVSDNYSVDIYHWDNFEDVAGTQIFCLFIVAKQKVENTFHHKAAASFCGMDPSGQNDSFSFLNLVFGRTEICNDEELAVVAAC